MPAVVSSSDGSLGTRLDDGSGVWPFPSKKPRKARRSSSAVVGFMGRQAIGQAVSNSLPGMSQPADWYPDPTGRHEHRYWDGSTWTEHVASHGRQSVDPDLSAKPPPTVDRPAGKVVRDVAKAGATGAGAGGGTVFTEPVLVVNQKAKLIEVNNEYAIYDANGAQLGAVRQVGQSALKKAAPVLTSYDQFMTHKLQVVDMGGNVLLAVTRPAKIMKSKVLVSDGAGRELGQVVQQNVFGKIRFSLEAGGAKGGSINAEDLRGSELSIPHPT